MVKNLSCNPADVGSIPDQRTKIPQAQDPSMPQLGRLLLQQRPNAAKKKKKNLKKIRMEFVSEDQEQGRMGVWSSIQVVSLETENSQWCHYLDLSFRNGCPVATNL